MLGNLRKKFNLVLQEGIQLSENILKSPSTGSPASVSQSSLATSLHEFQQTHTTPTTSINLHAGAELLAKNEHSWKDLHDLSAENADKADRIDQLITQMKTRTEKTFVDITDLNVSLVSLPSIINTLQTCCEIVEDVGVKCQDFERKLTELEDLKEVLELQEKQLDHRFEMAMYKEKKLAELEKVRESLAYKHAASVREYEQKLRQVQQERQAAFQDAFQSDIKYYKESGSIPKIEPKRNTTGTPEVVLEEIVLDDNDSKELDDFLNH